MFYYAISGLFGSRSTGRNEETPQGVMMVAPYRGCDQQVSNNDVILALNELKSTLYNINLKVEENHRELTEKILNIDKKYETFERQIFLHEEVLNHRVI